jgi:hypothetical protein
MAKRSRVINLEDKNSKAHDKRLVWMSPWRILSSSNRKEAVRIFGGGVLPLRSPASFWFLCHASSLSCQFLKILSLSVEFRPPSRRESLACLTRERAVWYWYWDWWAPQWKKLEWLERSGISDAKTLYWGGYISLLFGKVSNEANKENGDLCNAPWCGITTKNINASNLIWIESIKDREREGTWYSRAFLPIPPTTSQQITWLQPL